MARGTAQIVVRLKLHLLEWLHSVARENSATVSDVIRALIEEKMADGGELDGKRQLLRRIARELGVEISFPASS